MRRALFALALALALPTLLVAGGDGPKPLFNGKDLSTFEGLIEEYWKVQDGAIVGSAPKGLKFNTFLCSKQKFGDFELSFQVKMTKGGNSGVQIRSHIHDPKVFAVTGPQCDIGQGYWGSLYGEHFGGMMKAGDADVVKRAVKEGDWNDYAIRAVGKHVTIKIGGETTVDGDFPKAPDTGIIAFQLHSGGPLEVVFRNIRFKELSSK
jgi:hypothetical protein